MCVCVSTSNKDNTVILEGDACTKLDAAHTQHDHVQHANNTSTQVHTLSPARPSSSSEMCLGSIDSNCSSVWDSSAEAQGDGGVGLCSDMVQS